MHILEAEEIQPGTALAMNCVSSCGNSILWAENLRKTHTDGDV